MTGEIRFASFNASLNRSNAGELINDLSTPIQDNLNTHSPASLYKAFEPAEAQRILSRLEFCHTPKHGSWLNMAEIELSILSRQCLDRRLPDMDMLKREVAAWQDNRHHEEI